MKTGSPSLSRHQRPTVPYIQQLAVAEQMDRSIWAFVEVVTSVLVSLFYLGLWRHSHGNPGGRISNSLISHKQKDSYANFTTTTWPAKHITGNRVYHSKCKLWYLYQSSKSTTIVVKAPNVFTVHNSQSPSQVLYYSQLSNLYSRLHLYGLIAHYQRLHFQSLNMTSCANATETFWVGQASVKEKLLCKIKSYSRIFHS